jgi:hypothetical protein
MKNKMLKITNPQGGEEGKGGVKCLYMAAAERDHLLFLSEKEVLPSSPIVYSENKEPAQCVDKTQVCGWNSLSAPNQHPRS